MSRNQARESCHGSEAPSEGGTIASGGVEEAVVIVIDVDAVVGAIS